MKTAKRKEMTDTMLTERASERARQLVVSRHPVMRLRTMRWWRKKTRAFAVYVDFRGTGLSEDESERIADLYAKTAMNVYRKLKEL